MNGSQSGTYYRVEARTSNGEPVTVGKQTFVGKWKPIHFERSHIGVKSCPLSDLPASYGYFDYTAAKALQIWFINDTSISSLETRVTSHFFTMSYEFKDIGREDSLDWSNVKFKEAQQTER